MPWSYNQPFALAILRFRPQHSECSSHPPPSTMRLKLALRFCAREAPRDQSEKNILAAPEFVPASGTRLSQLAISKSYHHLSSIRWRIASAAVRRWWRRCWSRGSQADETSRSSRFVKMNAKTKSLNRSKGARQHQLNCEDLGYSLAGFVLYQ
jgi:hypothetical protein